MKTLVILASVAALMMISITDRLNHDNGQNSPKELVNPAPVMVNSCNEEQVSKNADSAASQNNNANFMASRKYTKNVFIIL